MPKHEVRSVIHLLNRLNPVPVCLEHDVRSVNIHLRNRLKQAPFYPDVRPSRVS